MHITVWIKELFLLANADFNLQMYVVKEVLELSGGSWKKLKTTTRGTSVTDSIGNERPN